MGYSCQGLIVSVAIVAPNLLLLRWPPRHTSGPVPPPGRLATALERVGQTGCLVLPWLTGHDAGFDGWAVLTGAAVLGYLGLWGRYLVRGAELSTLYEPWLGVPVPMAVLPVVAFGAASVWLSSWPLAIAVAVFAAGHLTTSLRVRAALRLYECRDSP